MVVPDLLYKRELEAHNGAYLRSLGLGVVALTAQELSDAQDINAQRPALSLPDCFALICSKRPNHRLVSGDKALRREAARTGAVFGLLWLLDCMEQRGVPVQSLAAGLTSLLHHPRCRLPRDEVDVRLARWRMA